MKYNAIGYGKPATVQDVTYSSGTYFRLRCPIKNGRGIKYICIEVATIQTTQREKKNENQNETLLLEHCKEINTAPIMTTDANITSNENRNKPQQTQHK